jgi:hypothetical protein
VAVISVNIGSAVRGGCGPLCLSTRPISFLLRKLLLFEDTFFGDDPAFRRLRPVVPSLYYKRPAAADPEAKEAPPPPPPPPPPPAAPEFDDINRFAASLVAPGRRGGPVRVIVVGGGAAGVELAFCIQARLARYGAGVAPTVTIVDRAPVLLSEGGPALTRELEAALAERRITRRVGVECSRVERRDPGAPQITVTLSSGEQLEAELVLWATGAAPHAEFHNNSQLELDERGFLRVGPPLRLSPPVPLARSHARRVFHRRSPLSSPRASPTCSCRGTARRWPRCPRPRPGSTRCARAPSSRRTCCGCSAMTPTS